MVVRTRHVFMCRKQQPADRQSGFGCFYFTFGLKNGVLGFLTDIIAIGNKYNAFILKKQLSVTLGRIKSYVTFF